MSYYTLPKKQTMNKIIPIFNESNYPIISFSLIHYLNVVKEFVNSEKQNILSKDTETKSNEINIDLLYKVINPYEFIHYKVPGSKFSVSKIKSESPIFYTLMEIINTFNIFDSFIGRNIKALHCGANNVSTIECMNIFRENNNDIIYDHVMDIDFINLKPINCIELMTVDFLYFEMNHYQINSETKIDANNYCLNFIAILCNILTYQNVNGTCIIKIETIYHKPILDILYLLTSMYEKIYIIKPYASDAFKNERFIICKNFISDYSKTIENNNTLKILKSIIHECIYSGKTISSLINCDLPYYFLNKIEESNIIIGHLQLEHYDQLINLLKNKNKEDRIETFKKTNIQKCIQWCEKHKIPYNKFVDKLNIFLPIVVYDDDGNLLNSFNSFTTSVSFESLEENNFKFEKKKIDVDVDVDVDVYKK